MPPTHSSHPLRKPVPAVGIWVLRGRLRLLALLVGLLFLLVLNDAELTWMRLVVFRSSSMDEWIRRVDCSLMNTMCLPSVLCANRCAHSPWIGPPSSIVHPRYSPSPPIGTAHLDPSVSRTPPIPIVHPITSECLSHPFAPCG